MSAALPQHQLKPDSRPLDAVLRPRVVAIVGASRDPTKRGHQIVRALLESRYAGTVVPVNPSGGELFGLQVATSLAAAPAVPDLAVICTPARTVPAVLEECADAGVAAAVVLAVGFGESGDAGRKLEADVAAIATGRGIRVVGPNTSGLLNVPLGLNLIGMRGVRAGHLALLVQSGNLVLQLVTECATRSSSGFTCVVGAGNETDLRFHEYLNDLARDDATRAILVHAEGFRDGRAFLRAAAATTLHKPIVLLKGARSAAGGETAKSHTGAVAGAYAVLRSALRQAGVIEVARADELFHVGETLAHQPPLARARGIAVLSDGGGHAALAVDALEALRAPMASLAEATQQRLRSLLGPAAAVRNPVDLAGAADGDPRVFARTLEIIASDAAVGAILVVGLFGGYAIRFAEGLLDAEVEAAQALATGAKNSGVGLVVHSLFAATRSAPLRALTDAGVPVVESIEVACRCMAALAERRDAVDRLTRAQVPRHSARPPTDRSSATSQSAPAATAGGEPTGPPTDRSRATSQSAQPTRRGEPTRPPLLRARIGDQDVLLEPEARALVSCCGVNVAPAVLCTTADEAAAAARAYAQPVAIKAVSPAALHKTEAGGVALGVRPEDAAAAYERVIASVSRYAAATSARVVSSVSGYSTVTGANTDVRGALVGPMLPAPVAELLAGVRRDPQFGLVLAVGAGGTLVEVLEDVALRVLPVSEADVREMLAEVRVGRLLHGARGGSPADMDALVRLILALANCADSIPDLDAIELNPVFAYPDRAVALDARVVFMRNAG